MDAKAGRRPRFETRHLFCVCSSEPLNRQRTPASRGLDATRTPRARAGPGSAPGGEAGTVATEAFRAMNALPGEYVHVDSEADPVFTIAHGIFFPMQSRHRNARVRKAQIAKSRGQATIAGLPTSRINANGVQVVFPRTLHIEVPGGRGRAPDRLHRRVAVLTAMGSAGLTVFELEDRYDDLRFSPYGAAFLTDVIIVQRHVELQGELKRVRALAKVCNSPHRHALRSYDIGAEGIVISAPRPDMEAPLTGSPHASTPRVASPRGDIG